VNSEVNHKDSIHSLLKNIVLTISHVLSQLIISVFVSSESQISTGASIHFSHCFSITVFCPDTVVIACEGIIKTFSVLLKIIFALHHIQASITSSGSFFWKVTVIGYVVVIEFVFGIVLISVIFQ
jgi:hypothetical protein